MKPRIELIKYTEWKPFIMTVNCKLCGTELEETHPAVIAQKIEDAVNWGAFESDEARYGRPVGYAFNVSGVGNVVVEAKKLKPAMEDMQDGYYAGESEYPQGTEYQAFVILRYGDTFFKKTGNADSYGEIVWSGILTPTKPKQITVTAWE